MIVLLRDQKKDIVGSVYVPPIASASDVDDIIREWDAFSSNANFQAAREFVTKYNKRHSVFIQLEPVIEASK